MSKFIDHHHLIQGLINEKSAAESNVEQSGDDCLINVINHHRTLQLLLWLQHAFVL